MLLPTFALLAAVQLAASLQTYKVPISMLTALLENEDCTLPKKFLVRAVVLWTPASNNKRSETFDFWYTNNGTSIDTMCHYNSTSVNVGPKGSTERYACENGNVEFIWERGTLTLIEKACPGSTATGNLEAAGSVTPDLGQCITTAANSTRGEGNACMDFHFEEGSFFSLQPAPPE